MTIPRPNCVTDDHLEYLDKLRASGITNMWGARPFLLREFGYLDDDAAATVLVYWIESFGERHVETA